MKKRLLRTFFLIFVFNLLGASSAKAAFSDKVTSSANSLSVASLDFSLSSASDFSPATLTPDNSSGRSISVVKEDSLSFKYNIQATKTSGDDNFCNALQLEAKLDGGSEYSGSLLGLNLSSPVVISGSQDDWEFTVSLSGDNSAFQGKTCDFNFIFNGWQTDSDGSWGFSDEEILQNTIKGGDWTAPESYVVDDLDDYYNDDFEIDYEAEDAVGAVAQVNLYYSYNNGDWQSLYTDTPGTSPVSGNFTVILDDLEGDGEYGFLTIAIDDSSNIEDDLDEDGNLDPDELNSLPADTLTTIDAAPPVTMLSVEPYMAVVNEQVYNGGFESGDLDGWTVGSSGDHQVVDTDSQTGLYSALIGFRDIPEGTTGYDLVKQSVSLPSLTVSTLSFWYHLLTDDLVSGGFFDTFVTPAGEDPIKVAHDGWDDPEVFLEDLDWKNVTYQLNDLEGKNVEIEFRVTQPYEDYKTWAYLDDVKVCAATNFLDDDDALTFNSSDGSGSDNLTVYYSIDGGLPEIYDDSLSLETGTQTVSYYSEDEAGNTEDEKEIEITVQEDPIDFGVVLNEFLPNPEGDDYAAAPNGEWVELYNNSLVPVNVDGWRLEDGSGNQMIITATKTEGAGTVIASDGVLKVYRRGSMEASGPDFMMSNSGDTVKLLKPDSNQVDSYRFTFTIEGKSFARDPDGTGAWKDPEVESLEPEKEQEQQDFKIGSENEAVAEEAEEIKDKEVISGKELVGEKDDKEMVAEEIIDQPEEEEELVVEESEQEPQPVEITTEEVATGTEDGRDKTQSEAVQETEPEEEQKEQSQPLPEESQSQSQPEELSQDDEISPEEVGEIDE